ncbi:Gfo/Idh/MocA family protein [Rubritalea spongiae]|uniref:Gfo/Idh/MocA family protein n=1 Tax=Rubritalea spongiae TaxID=430797 RepID=A0ABW5E3R9_9BACT
MNEKPIARRPFLQTAIGAGLATSIAIGQERADTKNGKKLGWAIVGLSRLSENRIGPAFLKTKNARLAGIVTGTPEKAKIWQKKYDVPDSGVYNYDDFDKIFENPEIDVVYIVLPNSMHREFTVRAAKAGKHVYVEKPMATNSEECREMIQACEKARVQLGVAYRLQFEPHHMEMMRFAKESVFGDVRHLDAGFCFKMRDDTGWRLKKDLGGGALLDVGVYIIQAARYIFGEEPVTVSALETKTDLEKFAEVDETTTWTMQFPSGKTANLISSFNLGGYNRMTVFADKGRFGMEPCFGTRGQKGWTSNPDVPLEFPQTDHFEIQIDLFSQAILDGKDWMVDGREGLRDHLVMDAIFKSVASSKAESVGEV